MNEISIFITVDEWRDISDWMYLSLDPTEQSPHGHFLLECEGTRRWWVTSDGAQTAVLYGNGPEPRGLADPTSPFSVLVNSRLFRNRAPQDATLTVRHDGEARRMTLHTDGIDASLPEHPDDFGDWRQVVDSVGGVCVKVETNHLRDACAAAMTVPFGLEPPPVTGALASIRGGWLRLETRWAGYPPTTIELTVDGGIDTGEVFLDPRRLFHLVHHIELDHTEITLPVDGTGPIGVRAGDYMGVLAPLDPLGGERNRLEELLSEFLGTESVEADHEGDYPVTTPDGHDLWVRLVAADTPTVQVFSVLAVAVDESPELFKQLNALNTEAPHVKVMWWEGSVMAEVDLVAETLDLADLANALRVVSRTADKYTTLLGAYFGPTADEDREGQP